MTHFIEAEQLKTYFSHITPISEEVWEEFASKLRVVHKTSGEIILHEGEVCNFVSFINKGLIRVYEIVEGIEVNRSFFMEGFFATEYQSFVNRCPSVEYLEVVQDAELVMIDYDHLQDMYQKHKSFERLGRLISESLYVRLRKKLERFQVKTPEERYLLMTRENPDYLDKIPHYHIASYLGIKPQSLSRIRSRLR
ncbi:MAG: Crp/Fnr family transcriptional regulator [Bacteroidota bacterium]